jgi:hypothetical protein
MATFKGYSKHKFWSSKPIEDFQGAIVRLHGFMSKTRFEALSVPWDTPTDLPPPTYQNNFHCIRQLVEKWKTTTRSIAMEMPWMTT